MSRLKILTANDQTPAQRDLAERISASRGGAQRSNPLAGDDGRVGGPFNALLYAPELGDAVQAVGAKLRFDSNLPALLRETAILTVGQYWRAEYEWYSHSNIALREGMDEADIAAIKEGQAPAGEELATVHSFVSQLLKNRRVDDETYAKTVALLGESGVVELVTITGYYCLISSVLNAFEVDLPEGVEPQFSQA